MRTQKIRIEFFRDDTMEGPEGPETHLIIQTTCGDGTTPHWIALNRNDMAAYLKDLMTVVCNLGPAYALPTLKALEQLEKTIEAENETR